MPTRSLPAAASGTGTLTIRRPGPAPSSPGAILSSNASPRTSPRSTPRASPNPGPSPRLAASSSLLRTTPRPSPSVRSTMFPAAHQLDLNHLWQQVQELSAILAHNRETTVGLVRQADEIRKSQGNGALPRTGANGDAAAPDREIELEEENGKLRQEVAELRGENEDLALLVQDYEAVLEKVLEGLRMYAHDQSVATINIHSAYTQQLAQERQSNAALRQEQAESEARLAKISRLLREAYQQDTALEPDIVIEGLKVENRALRDALGLPNDDDPVGAGNVDGGTEAVAPGSHNT